jgi:hypothetical protein
MESDVAEDVRPQPGLLGPLEMYGEVASSLFVAAVGIYALVTA